MSGGVDSSVAAALLHEQGYEVIGVTMRLWTEERGRKSSAATSSAAASKTSTTPAAWPAQLGIRHYVMNFEQEFKENVVDRFVAEYAAGRTPNPCVRCNEHIKYRALLDRLPALDADFVATGHYARVHDRRRRTAIDGARSSIPAQPLRASTPPRTSPTCSTCSGRSSFRGSCCRSAS